MAKIILIIGVMLLSCVQGHESGFNAPDGMVLYPAFSILDVNKSTPSGLIAKLGRGRFFRCYHHFPDLID